MCGIWFHYDINGITGKTKKYLLKLFNKIKHRGPDASNVRYYNANAMMGFHRLAIVDPTGSGMQPFEDNRFSCIINGEIYNHRFLKAKYKKYEMQSNSDCEIVLHIFRSIIGKQAVELRHLEELCQILNGEFAFIIYDTKTQICYYGTDELRSRPLFLAFNSEDDSMKSFTLCSEQKGLHGNIIIPIQSGTVGTISLSQGSFQHAEKQYYWFDKQIKCDDTKDEAAKKLVELLVESVSKKLNPEREFCFLLSGGLDSSLVCGIAANLLKPIRIRTFTVGFVSRKNNDELPPDILAARKVAKHINSIHTELFFTYEDGINILRDVIYANESWDQTTTRASIPMALTCRAIKRKHPEMAVIYSGEVADELLMGYIEWQSAPNPEEARNHMIKRLKDVTFFDGLRADRIVASVGCELRLPFFCKELLNYTLSLPPEYLCPKENEGVEKYLLRYGFSNYHTSYIPGEVLWRTKNAFSDATSIIGVTSWKEYLKNYADKQITDSRFAARNEIYSCHTPQTKEDMLYREIFDEFGYEATTIPYKWLQNWSPEGTTDSSATVIKGFVSN